MGAIGHGWLASHIQSTVLCFFLIKCYQNTPILTSLHIVYGCFYILTAGLSSCHRNHMAHRPTIFTLRPFTEKFTDPYI